MRRLWRRDLSKEERIAVERLAHSRTALPLLWSPSQLEFGPFGLRSGVDPKHGFGDNIVERLVERHGGDTKRA